MTAAYLLLAAHLLAMAGYAIAALSSVRTMRMLDGHGRFIWRAILGAIFFWISVLFTRIVENPIDRNISKWNAFWLSCNISGVTSGLMLMALARGLISFPLDRIPSDLPYYLAGHISVPLAFIAGHIGIALTWQKWGNEPDE